MYFHKNVQTVFGIWGNFRFELKTMVVVVVAIMSLEQVDGVINGKMKDKGLYVIQSVAEPRYVKFRSLILTNLITN